MERKTGGVELQNLLEKMVEDYGNKIYRLAVRFTGDRTQAEDLTQETFLKAYINLDRFDHSREAGPWLFKIATNLCRNWLRDRREQPVNNIEEHGEERIQGPENLYIQKESEEELFAALHNLPQMYREVLLLKHVGDLSYAEISQVLEIDLSLVKNRLYRGRIMLQNKMRGKEV